MWKINIEPLEAQAKKSPYTRRVLYVDKERHVVLRSDLYDHQGQEVKRYLANKVESYQGVWLAKSMTMMNFKTNRLSHIARLKIYTALHVPEALLSQRTLTDGAFREAELGKLRAQLTH